KRRRGSGKRRPRRASSSATRASRRSASSPSRRPPPVADGSGDRTRRPTARRDPRSPFRSPTLFLRLVSAENEDGVVAPEPKGVGHAGVDRRGAGDIGHVVQIAPFPGLL